MWWETRTPNPEFKRMPFVINIQVSFCEKADRGTNFTKILHRLICAHYHPQKKKEKRKNTKPVSCMWGPKIQRCRTLMKSFLGLAFISSCVIEYARQIQALQATGTSICTLWPAWAWTVPSYYHVWCYSRNQMIIQKLKKYIAIIN